MKKMIIIALMTISFAVFFAACGSGKDNSAAPASQEETPGKEETTGQEEQSRISEPAADKPEGSDVDADTDEAIQKERGEDYEESIEVMIPEGPVEEMVPEESVELEIEEGLQGALG